jgi:glycerol-3-phosphate dehydrogenase subunit C
MNDTKRISYLPTEGLSYDPSERKYWQADLLRGEVTRIFEICHGCRMCFKYCDSFPTLFKFIDERHDGDVHKITGAETQEVMDACFQCKLCEVQCPYTPRDGHDFQLDFPKLVHRYDAVNAQESQPSLRDKLLSDPDGAGQMARLSFGLANALNKVPLHRWAMEKALGIHREKELPDFALRTFESWAKKNGRVRSAPPAEAVLFQTCYVQNNEPEIGRDALSVMDENKIDVACVAGLGCCGMPAWEQGDLQTLRQRARRNLDLLDPFVEAGAKIAVINPTCSMMMRREYPELLEGRDRARAKKLAEQVRDACELVWSIRNEPRFSTRFRSTPGERVAYHAPCHLRAQGVGFKGRDLLKKIPGVQTEMVLECSGHDGTWAMKVEGYEASKRVGDRAFQALQQAHAEVWATECPLAAIQIGQHAGNKPLHPLSVLARAYRADGFPNRLAEPPETEEK